MSWFQMCFCHLSKYENPGGRQGDEQGQTQYTGPPLQGVEEQGQGQGGQGAVDQVHQVHATLYTRNTWYISRIFIYENHRKVKDKI